MRENINEGNLAQTPLPRLLFCLWQKETSGQLRLQKGTLRKLLFLKEGNIVVERDSFPAKEFIKVLVKKKIIQSAQAEKCESHAAQKKVSLMRSLVELGLLSSLRLWNLIEAFFKLSSFPLFDWPQGEYFFEPRLIPQEGRFLGNIPTIDFVLQGVRQMRNLRFIENFLPAEDETIQVSFPYYFELLHLEAHEKYLLNILQNSQNLKDVYEWSELGRKETRKILFSFLILDIARVSEEKERKRPIPDFSLADSEKIWNAFNEKCSYIYKYISKELGAVALNVMAKCLEEVKPSLSPAFQKIELSSDGKISCDSALIANLNLSTEVNLKNFLRSLDEILAAEVLAVKRTLGNDHESTLVKNLEKIGCL